MRRARAVVLLVALMTIFAMLVLPAVAHHKDDHADVPRNESGGGGGNAGGGGGGNTGNRGNSDSNPDGGGVDKPYPADGQPAGSQGPDYFDGNNGCGQDKRSGEPRETGTEHTGWDDNNGWCGKPNTGDATVAALGTGEAEVLAETSTVVAASGFRQVESTPVVIGQPVRALGTIEPARFGEPIQTSVLGIKLVRGRPLGLTGLLYSVAAWLAAAGLLLLAGYTALRIRRQRVGA